jgi:hypothetical protein
MSFAMSLARDKIERWEWIQWATEAWDDSTKVAEVVRFE